ncbi:MAG TPA: dihydropteroate synthase [Candidatus Polarisedimenticolia bacterium]|nr:dihydropteroate synthase [Candidatus Polarisedimenticolia bacterium]
MTYNLLLTTAPLSPFDQGEREALGVPRGFRAPAGEWTLRLEGLSRRSSRLLATAARTHGGRIHLGGSGPRRPILLSLPAKRWAPLRRVLAAGQAPLPLLAREIHSSLVALAKPSRRLRLARRSIRLGGRTLIFGVLNVTPDSFFDGGRWLDPDRAVERAEEMVSEGADGIDVGGESTRPGSRPVPASEEIRRILPVIERIAHRVRVPLSVDTTKAAVARAALSAGAEIVNDISGFSFDPRMASVAARYRSGVILSHIRGRPRSMQDNPRYRHLVPEVLAFLRKGIGRALAAGVHRESILIDPGIGFGKTAGQNLLLLRHLRLLRSAGCPILVGASRKSFLGKILDRGPEERLEGSLAAAALAIFNGASALRVHDVAETVRTARVAEAIRNGAMER